MSVILRLLKAHHNSTNILKTSAASQKRDINSRQIYERLIEKC